MNAHEIYRLCRLENLFHLSVRDMFIVLDDRPTGVLKAEIDATLLKITHSCSCISVPNHRMPHIPPESDYSVWL